MEMILLKEIDKNSKSFEDIKHVDENGVELWYARELMKILEYNKWENFEKVKYLIDMINNMDIKDKLKLAVCMSQSKWSGLIYNTKENYEKFDSMLKDIDEEYRTTLIDFSKYKLIMFVMAKIMEMEPTEQNKIALYLFNNIKNQ